MGNGRLRPIVKWAGGKGQLVDEISRKYPVGLGFDINRYAEPFVGGGAILFDILGRFELNAVYISDINAELINMYTQVRNNVEDVISMLGAYQSAYLPLCDEGRKNFYYEKRNRFNEMIENGESKNSTESAALFIFLNRTCFNGLYRVNKRGLFNVPFGAYKNPKICAEDNLRAVSSALTKVTIVCGDYRKSRDFINSRTFVYFDPPYRPLNATSNFTSYTENEWNDKAQTELAQFVQILSGEGAHVVVSNSDPKNTDPQDNFFDILYAKHTIQRIFANRMINSDAGARGKISELLICNY